MLYDPNDQMRIYDFSDSIYVSEDFGSNWIYKGTVSTTIRQSAIAENNSDIILISSSSDIWKSINGSSSFTNISNNLPIGYIQDIAFDPNNDVTRIESQSRGAAAVSAVFQGSSC